MTSFSADLWGRLFVKVHGPSSNRSREIPPEAVGGGSFDSCFRHNLRPDVDNDVLSGMAVDNFGMDVRV